MIKLTDENVILYSYKDISLDKGVRYFPTIYVNVTDDIFDSADLKKQVLHDAETDRLVDVVLKQYKDRINNGDAETNVDDQKYREVVKVLESIKYRKF